VKRLALLLVSPLVLAGALLWARRFVSTPPEPTLPWDDDVRREVQAIVEQRYVEPIDGPQARRLFHAALQGYVSHLDPFSRYVPPEDRKRVEEEANGTFGGIGVLARPGEGGLRITAVREDSPADRAGLEPGDVLESVGGEALSGRDLAQMFAMIRGEPGTSIEVSVVHGGAARRVTIERALVPSDTVRSVRLLPGDPPVGYVRVEQFADTTAGEVRDALNSLVDGGARGVVLDLRENLGGVVRAAVDVASLFLPPGSTVCVVRRREGGVVDVTERPDGFDPVELPLAVLVDEGTASASEILAGALQDHGRAVLVGERTWGKFLVQTLVETRSDGGVVRLTTARYETPRGRSAPRDEARGLMGGLLPDVRAPELSDAQRSLLRAEFDRQSGPRWRTLPGSDPEPGGQALAAALRLLRGGLPPSEPVPSRAL
jgi:carboxyl-terminal processing protease